MAPRGKDWDRTCRTCQWAKLFGVAGWCLRPDMGALRTRWGEKKPKDIIDPFLPEIRAVDFCGSHDNKAIIVATENHRGRKKLTGTSASE